MDPRWIFWRHIVGKYVVPKIKHFLWQLVTGCIAVKKNLHMRGIPGDICCARCGAEEESINHVFLNALLHFRYGLFQRFQQIQLCSQQALSLWTYHLFWRVVPQMEYHQFAWILWYIWKGRNNKVFSNLDMDLWIPLNWQKRNQNSGLRHKYWMTKRGLHR